MPSKPSKELPEIPMGAASPRAGKPIHTTMIVGLSVVAAIVLGFAFYSLTPYLSSNAIDAEEIPGITEAE